MTSQGMAGLDLRRLRREYAVQAKLRCRRCEASDCWVSQLSRGTLFLPGWVKPGGPDHDSVTFVTCSVCGGQWYHRGPRRASPTEESQSHGTVEWSQSLRGERRCTSYHRHRHRAASSERWRSTRDRRLQRWKHCPSGVIWDNQNHTPIQFQPALTGSPPAQSGSAPAQSGSIQSNPLTPSPIWFRPASASVPSAPVGGAGCGVLTA
ncbi:unnamed protein product, partial [Boreogadus saida]